MVYPDVRRASAGVLEAGSLIHEPRRWVLATRFDRENTTDITPHGRGEFVDVRCPTCGLLLAKRRGLAEIQIQWKELQLTAWGRARVQCRKCGTVSEI